VFFRNNANAPLSMFIVVAPSINPNGGTVWPRRTFAGYNPYLMSSSGCCEEG
jgi:hypothetical protein